MTRIKVLIRALPLPLVARRHLTILAPRLPKSLVAKLGEALLLLTAMQYSKTLYVAKISSTSQKRPCWPDTASAQHARGSLPRFCVEMVRRPEMLTVLNQPYQSEDNSDGRTCFLLFPLLPKRFPTLTRQVKWYK